MKNVSRLALLLVLMFSITNALAQTKAKKGDYSFLKDVESVKVIFDYSDIKVEGEDEEVYVSNEVKKRNKKEEGSGDKWKKGWYDLKKIKV